MCSAGGPLIPDMQEKMEQGRAVPADRMKIARTLR
jgi:hypothetical protein